MSTLVSLSAPVRGGRLSGAVWEPSGTPRATVLAVHGITASHLAWQWLAEALPGVRILAPDLRGRGPSRDLPGPWGMEQHADDCPAFLEAAGADEVLAIGHSMGGFVVGALAARPDSGVRSILLVDGGLPIPLPAGVGPEQLPGALIGPAADRLSTEYASPSAYRAFWEAHPAFAGVHDERLGRYADYDLVGAAPRLRPSGRIEAVTQDSLDLQDEDTILGRLRRLAGPIPFVRAPRGLLDEVPPLYPDAAVARWCAEVPALVVHEAVDVNHYTVVMSDAGVRQLLPLVEAALETAQKTGDDAVPRHETVVDGR